MASPKGAPLIGAFFNSIPNPANDRKRAVKPRKNQTTKGEGSVTSPLQQHGELASDAAPTMPRMPTDQAMMKDHARSAKRSATRDWVDGRMTTKEHAAVHKRADHVLAAKPVRAYKGASGERIMKGMR